jgi:small subunit ribosomal protein S20
MPNTKSAIRRVRRVKKQTQVNRIRKSKYKNAIKQMELHLKLKKRKKQKNIFQNFNQF